MHYSAKIWKYGKESSPSSMNINYSISVTILFAEAKLNLRECAIIREGTRFRLAFTTFPPVFSRSRIVPNILLLPSSSSWKWIVKKNAITGGCRSRFEGNARFSPREASLVCSLRLDPFKSSNERLKSLADGHWGQRRDVSRCSQSIF